MQKGDIENETAFCFYPTAKAGGGLKGRKGTAAQELHSGFDRLSLFPSASSLFRLSSLTGSTSPLTSLPTLHQTGLFFSLSVSLVARLMSCQRENITTCLYCGRWYTAASFRIRDAEQKRRFLIFACCAVGSSTTIDCPSANTAFMARTEERTIYVCSITREQRWVESFFVAKEERRKETLSSRLSLQPLKQLNWQRVTRVFGVKTLLATVCAVKTCNGFPCPGYHRRGFTSRLLDVERILKNVSVLTDGQAIKASDKMGMRAICCELAGIRELGEHGTEDADEKRQIRGGERSIT